MKRQKKSATLPTLFRTNSVRFIFSSLWIVPPLFLSVSWDEGRERERETQRRNFADNGRADIDSDGQLGLRGPSGRICTRLRVTLPPRPLPPTCHSSHCVAKSKVSHFSSHFSLSFPSLSLSHSFALVSGESHLSRVVVLIFWIIFPRVVCRIGNLPPSPPRWWVEKSKGRERKRKRKKHSYGRGSPYATYIPFSWLEYIDDDNATIATEKDTRMSEGKGRRRRNKGTKSTPTCILSLASIHCHV